MVVMIRQPISLGTQFYGKPADYGEKIFEGKPQAAARDARVTEVYLGRPRDLPHGG